MSFTPSWISLSNQYNCSCTKQFIGIKSPLNKRTASIRRKLQNCPLCLSLAMFWSPLHTLECGSVHEGRGGEFRHATQLKKTEFIIRFRILKKNKRTRVTIWNYASSWLYAIVTTKFAEDKIFSDEYFLYFLFPLLFFSVFLFHVDAITIPIILSFLMRWSPGLQMFYTVRSHVQTE